MRLVVRTPAQPLRRDEAALVYTTDGDFRLSAYTTQVLGAKPGLCLDFAEDQDTPGTWYVGAAVAKGALVLRSGNIQKKTLTLRGAGRRFLQMMGLPIQKTRLLLRLPGVEQDGRTWYGLVFPAVAEVTEQPQPKPESAPAAPVPPSAPVADIDVGNIRPTPAAPVPSSAPVDEPPAPVAESLTTYFGPNATPVDSHRLRAEATPHDAPAAATIPSTPAPTPDPEPAAPKVATADGEPVCVVLTPDGDIRLAAAASAHVGAEAGKSLRFTAWGDQVFLTVCPPGAWDGRDLARTNGRDTIKARITRDEHEMLRAKMKLEVRRLALLPFLIPVAARPTELSTQTSLAWELLLDQAVPKQAKATPAPKAKPAPAAAPAPVATTQPPQLVAEAESTADQVADFEELEADNEENVVAPTRKPVPLPLADTNPFVYLTHDNELRIPADVVKRMGIAAGWSVRVDTIDGEPMLVLGEDAGDVPGGIALREAGKNGKEGVRAYLRLAFAKAIRDGYPLDLKMEPPDVVVIPVEDETQPEAVCLCYRLLAEQADLLKKKGGAVHA